MMSKNEWRCGGEYGVPLTNEKIKGAGSKYRSGQLVFVEQLEELRQ